MPPSAWAIDQIGYLVPDLDAAVAARLATGLGPWTVYRGTRLVGDYRGAATEVRIDVGLAYRGAVQIELIQLRSDRPCPYADARGPIHALHHVATQVDDLDAAVRDAAAQGWSAVFVAGNEAVRVAYLEHPAEPGAYHELIAGEGMRAMMDAGIAAARDWDGRDPITTIMMGD